MNIVEIVTNGIFIGFGVSIGTYFGNKLMQTMLEKKIKELKVIVKNIKA